jgi:hypothetical protein
MRKRTAFILMTISAIFGFMASQIIEDFLSGFKEGHEEGQKKVLMTDVGSAEQRGDLDQYKSEEFRYKRRGLLGSQMMRLEPRIDEQIKAQGYASEDLKSELRLVLDELEIIGRHNDDQKALDMIERLRKQYALGQPDYVYRNWQLVLNENKEEPVQNIELPLVQIEEFASDYYAAIESFEHVLQLLEKARQERMEGFPVDALRGTDKMEDQLDYTTSVQAEIGAIYGWRIATALIIRMGADSVTNQDEFDASLGQWLGYQVDVLDKVMSFYAEAPRMYSLDGTIMEAHREHVKALSRLSLVLKKQSLRAQREGGPS